MIALNILFGLHAVLLLPMGADLVWEDVGEQELVPVERFKYLHFLFLLYSSRRKREPITHAKLAAGVTTSQPQAFSFRGGTFPDVQSMGNQREREGEK